MPYIGSAPLETRTDTADRLVRVTEAAACAALKWIGKNDKIGADQAGVDAMETELIEQEISCQVVIGEGEKDGAPELRQGTIYGSQFPQRYDLAVDPVEGTTCVAKNLPGAMSIAALGERGSFLPWVGVPYMKKLVVGRKAAHLLDKPFEEGGVDIRGNEATNMERVAAALEKPGTELVVAMLNRDRNYRVREAAERIGARILLLDGLDVTPALQTCIGREVDILYSSGGAPEGVITAAAIAALGGNMQAMMDPQNADETEKVDRAKLLGKVLDLKALVGDGELHFAATGITPGPLLTGARFVRGVPYPGTSIKRSRPAKTNGQVGLLR